MTHLEFERGQTSVAATGIMSALAARVLILLVYGELWVGLPGLLLLCDITCGRCFNSAERGAATNQLSAAVGTVTNSQGSKAHRFVACETGFPAGGILGLNPDGVAGWDLMTGMDVSSENCTDRR
jgi:hypothetical protein